MKVKEKVSKHKSEGFNDEIEFTFKQSGKAFNILVSRLYNDPIKAILRELSCNGYDAQVEAGNEQKPMLIHLPNRLEPHFSIRDYGIGLSQKAVKDVYTRVFESTKTDSNDFTGCLGLGSKTPFSYTNNFIVESFYNGKHYIYNAYFNEQGVPCMAMLAGNGNDTTEPNGVKITISVKHNDFENWRRKAEEVFEYFAVTPKVVGNNITVKTPDYIMEGTNWKLRSKQFGSRSGMKVVMGNVAYPVDGFSDTSLTAEQENLLECNIDLFVNIGDVEMEASREGLHFDSRTKNVLRQKIDAVIVESKKRISENFNKCISLWEARCKYIELVKNFPEEIIDAVGMKNITFKGEQLFTNSYYKDVYFPTFADNPIFSFKERSRYYWRTSGGKVKKAVASSCKANPSIRFFINDLKTGSFTRTQALAESENIEIILCKFEDSTQKQEFIDMVGILESDFEYTSSLPKPVRASRTGRGKTTKICRFSGGSSFISHCWENEDDVDLSLGGAYVEISRHRVVHRHNIKRDVGTATDRKVKIVEEKDDFDPRFVEDVIAALKMCGYDFPVVYGVKTSILPKVKKSKGKWVNILELAKVKIPHFMSKFNTCQIEHNSASLSELEYELSGRLDILKRVKGLISPDSEVHDLFKKRDSLRASRLYKDKSRILRNVYSKLFGKTYKDEVEETNIEEYASEIKDRYKLLGDVSRWLGEDCLEHVALYIDAVDKKENS